MPEWKEVLDEAGRYAVRYLDGLPSRPVGSNATLASLQAALDLPLPARGTDPREVIADLARHADPGVVASSSGRFFGFVVGGATPAALAADWLTSVWDQNAGLYVLGPAAAVVEDVAGRWLASLLGLPPGGSAGFVTGAQMANFTGLAVGLHTVLGRAGWNVPADGLWGAPRVRVLAGRGRHGTIDRALRFLGMGTGSIVEVEMDDQGRMLPSALRPALAALAAEGAPVIVCAQAGNVNSGAFDPIGEICDLAHARGAWVHVDGAFGLWAAASPRFRHLVDGVERADSWATDAHKWLNVPYDSGLIFCADPAAHRAAMGARAGYLIHGAEGERDALDYGPEHSRRARGFPVYAAIRALGSDGVAALVERCCDLAGRFAERLAASGRATILGDVVLNQVLVHFTDDATTRSVIEQVQREGTCWMSGTTWQGRAAMRISVSNWSTTPQDVDRSVEAILRCV
jgi:glutamate/tyrosine decarboxylase-like PLP-dependent enzyme